LSFFPNARVFHHRSPEVHIEVQKPIAYLQGTFDFQGIRLSDYAMEPQDTIAAATGLSPTGIIVNTGVGLANGCLNSPPRLSE
jgi:hypothetical protein